MLGLRLSQCRRREASKVGRISVLETESEEDFTLKAPSSSKPAVYAYCNGQRTSSTLSDTADVGRPARRNRECWRPVRMRTAKKQPPPRLFRHQAYGLCILRRATGLRSGGRWKSRILPGVLSVERGEETPVFVRLLILSPHSAAVMVIGDGLEEGCLLLPYTHRGGTVLRPHLC